MKHYAAAMDIIKELQKLGQSRVQLAKSTPHESTADDSTTVELYELGVELAALQHEKYVWPRHSNASSAHLFLPHDNFQPDVFLSDLTVLRPRPAPNLNCKFSAPIPVDMA